MSKYLTVVYKLDDNEDVQDIVPKPTVDKRVAALSWSHALHDVKRLEERVGELAKNTVKQEQTLGNQQKVSSKTPRRLTFVIANHWAAICRNVELGAHHSIPKRTVTIELTPEQMKAINLQPVGSKGGVTIYEGIQEIIDEPKEES